MKSNCRSLEWTFVLVKYVASILGLSCWQLVLLLPLCGVHQGALSSYCSGFDLITCSKMCRCCVHLRMLGHAFNRAEDVLYE